MRIVAALRLAAARFKRPATYTMNKFAAGLLASLLLTSPALAQPASLPSVPLISPQSPTDVRQLGSDAFAAPPSATGPMPSFASLFTDLGKDVRRLPTRENAVIVAIAGAASLAVLPQDGNVTRTAATVPSLDTTFEAGAVLGSGIVQGGAAVATYAIGRAFHDRQVAVLGSDLVRAQLITMTMTQGLKLSVGRTRPDGSRYSFPSGHSSATFATASVLQRHYGWKAGVPAYGVAVHVAGSRLSENKHYMSDVIFGAALGIVAGRAVTFGHGASTFALTPIAVPRGGGVGLTLVGAQ